MLCSAADARARASLLPRELPAGEVTTLGRRWKELRQLRCGGERRCTPTEQEGVLVVAVKELDEQRQAARLPHGDARVLRTGHGEQRAGHVVFIMSPQHGQEAVYHLHLVDTKRKGLFNTILCFILNDAVAR